MNKKQLFPPYPPAGPATTYSYDNRDNLIALTDAENQRTEFAYDRNNRLIRETRGTLGLWGGLWGLWGTLGTLGTLFTFTYLINAVRLGQ